MVDRYTEAFEFQSSPDPKAGRNVILKSNRKAVIREMFQSSPDPKAGRNGVDDTPF